MSLETILAQKGTKIVNRWLALILETYPADAQRFLKKQKDHFANPVGTTLNNELEHIYKELLQGVAPERLSLFLDRIIRIRAVQDFTPSQAISFIFRLKNIIREEAGKEIREQELLNDFMLFESRLDEAALLAFDIYMKCKEKIYEIKANESKNQVSRLLLKAGLTCEIPSWNREPKEDNSAPS
ncbi:MAG: RsbRD N-terminal domain-containing protein [Proteobacteria bacterium]|nr:RsbRD N-terminal domain-containing protein [Pseudomonadota bacterium]